MRIAVHEVGSLGRSDVGVAAKKLYRYERHSSSHHMACDDRQRSRYASCTVTVKVFVWVVGGTRASYRYWSKRCSDWRNEDLV